MMKNNIQYKNLSQQDIVDFQCDDCGMINQLCKGDKETEQALLSLLERIPRKLFLAWWMRAFGGIRFCVSE